MIYQNLSHQMSRNSEEMGTALPIGELLADQAEISLMYQGSRPERARGTLIRKVVLREPAQFIVHKRYESVDCHLVALFPFDQESGDLLGDRHGSSSQSYHSTAQGYGRRHEDSMCQVRGGK